MKRLIACVLLLSSFSTFGYEQGAVDAFTAILPVGTYQGETEINTNCDVNVAEVNFPEKAITVTVNDNNNRLFKVIKEGSEFRLRAYKSEFIQTERFYVDDNRTSYVDRIVRTVNAGENRLYVVVANEATVNREVRQEAVECVVKLKK
ncbi:MAG: hypothetical protein K2Q18_18620 [Bdellovibrionales bacterium]|nr:hypothetical protein [Bdellovibrionales bacterium]